jgi:hypothetical protein
VSKDLTVFIFGFELIFFVPKPEVNFGPETGFYMQGPCHNGPNRAKYGVSILRPQTGPSRPFKKI